MKKMQKISPPREERAKPSRMQVFRMARIVALLKKNRLPGRLKSAPARGILY